MKTDREQIRKIADAISYQCQQSKMCDNCFERGRVCSDYKTAEKLYKAGYRKASDVVDEFVKRFRDLLIDKVPKDYKENYEHYNYPIDTIEMFILKVADEMRQEVK